MRPEFEQLAEKSDDQIIAMAREKQIEVGRKISAEELRWKLADVLSEDRLFRSDFEALFSTSRVKPSPTFEPPESPELSEQLRKLSLPEIAERKRLLDQLPDAELLSLLQTHVPDNSQVRQRLKAVTGVEAPKFDRVEAMLVLLESGWKAG